MMHKLIISLALCALLASGPIKASRVFEPSSRLLGITFTAPENSNSNNEERRQISENEVRRALFQTDSNVDTTARYAANKEELQRRARLNRILDAIGASLAPAQASGQQQVAEPVASSHAPLYRSGRIYPSRDTNENLRNFRLPNTPSEYQGANAFERLRADSVERWEPSMLDGGSSSAKSQRSSTGIRGLVWPSNRPINLNSSPPFYSSLKLGGNANGGGDGGPQPSNIYGVNQQRPRSGQLLAGSAGSQAQHHRLGGNSEEIAMQAPVHSRSTNDYEWKRVEQSRWNNLRGMWGKRAAMRDDEDPAQKYKELIEWEAQQEAAQRAGEMGGQDEGYEQGATESKSSNESQTNETTRKQSASSP